MDFGAGSGLCGADAGGSPLERGKGCVNKAINLPARHYEVRSNESAN